LKHETQRKKNMVIVIALNTTFNDISVTLSHNVVSITPHLRGILTHNISDDRH